MLSHLWRKKIGTAIIDVCVDSYSQTVSVGDVSGNSYIFDYYGNIIAEYGSDIPVWGVSHTTQKDGVIVFTSGHADKSTGNGLIAIYSDDDLVLQHEVEEPIWDTCICSNMVIASGWKGGLYLFDFNKGILIERIEMETPLYGICKLDDESILVNAERNGVYTYSVKDGLNKTVSLKNNCYNISISPAEGFYVTGTHGPYMFATSSNGVSIGKKEGRDIFSVATIGRFVITGSKAGELSIWSPSDPSKNIYTSNQGAEIWNIAYDEKQGHIFLALGDGSISCFNIDLNEQRIAAVESFLAASKGKKGVDLVTALEEGVYSTVVIPHLIEAINDGKIGEKESKQLIEIINNRRIGGEPDSGRFTKSILCFAIGDYRRAVDGLQIVDSSHPYYSLAVVLLAKSMIGLGDYDAARQYLVTNAYSLEKKYIPKVMAILDGLGVESSGSLTKAVSSNPVSYRTLVGDENRREVFSIATQKNKKKGMGKALDYGVINYIKYEYPNRSDHAKKILEKNIVEGYLLNSHLPSDGKPVSLDIGCATCRYPLWLSENGFHAVGYDINDDAIRICQMRAEGNNAVHIEKKNILDHEPEYDRFSLITCMMGTFNHIPMSDQGRFVRWIYDSLKTNGVFIFSSWNRECPYTTHLHFYNREEREYIQRNTRTPDSIETLLKDSGFIVEKSVPISFLPDECYEAWLGEIEEADVINMDQHFLDLLNGTNSQMYVFCGVKA